MNLFDYDNMKVGEYYVTKKRFMGIFRIFLTNEENKKYSKPVTYPGGATLFNLIF